MSRPQTQALSAAILRLLRPLVRILLRNAVPFKTFTDLAKRVYIDVAMEEFALARKKQTTSRVSILTGLSRKEVQRVLQLPELTDTQATARYSRAVRVLTAWIRDPEFRDGQGKPLPLVWQATRRSFSTLVKRYSGDIPVRAMLDELLRVGAVQRLKDGRIRLLARGYVPRHSETDKLEILGTDVADLVFTIDHNIQHGATDLRFQRKVMYDNLPTEAVDKFRPLAGEHAQRMLESMDRWLARHDRDVNPSQQGTGRVRAGIGIYYFEEELGRSS